MLTGLRHGVRCALGLTVLIVLLSPSSASAQITRVSSSDHRNAVGFTVGGFFPRGEDGRVEGDAMVADLNDLIFEVNDFRGASFSGEWLFSLGNYLEGGVGAGYYKRSVNSVYRDFVNVNNTEIEQDLKLRIAPITGTIRFLPVGRGSVEPYVGVGVGIFNWRWSETGEFVDAADNSIFRGNFVANGTSVGPVILAGVRAPIADAFDVGGEVQFQRATGDTGGISEGFVGDKIDLGGWHALFTMHIRF